MLHFVAFPPSDTEALARLETLLGSEDRLVFCELASTWPEDHRLCQTYSFIRLVAGEVNETLAAWLEEIQPTLYWSPSDDTAAAPA